MSNRIEYCGKSGQSLKYSVCKPDGTPKGAPLHPLPESQTPGYYTAISHTNLEKGDKVLIYGPEKVLYEGEPLTYEGGFLTVDETLDKGEFSSEAQDLASTMQKEKEVKMQPNSHLKNATRDQVFICYSHKDERWLNDLQTHLKPYVRNGSVTAWSDKKIAPGSKWFPEIEAALNSAKVAVLLVTPNFLASDFIHEHELGPLLKKAEQDKVRIIWIPVRACSYKETPLKDYQAVIDPGKPLANMKAERDKAWVEICKEIKNSAQEN